MQSTVVGIDLGTTNTVVAHKKDGRLSSLVDEQGYALIPSVVSFHPSGQVLVGRAAKDRRWIDARNTIYSTKRLIGRTWESPEVQRARMRFAFELREGAGQGVLVAARGETYTLPELSAYVLRKAKAVAEAALGEPVHRAVITVPANFNDLQRAATKVAGRIAGFEVLRILNEPTAAALAYGYGPSITKAEFEKIAVYDFGGGTFDVTLLARVNNVFEVLATAGDMFLGGDDIDVAIAERIADAFLQHHHYDPRVDRQVFERLRATGEQIKVNLSVQPITTIDLTEVAYGPGGRPLSLRFTMARDQLEALVSPLVDRTFRVCEEALRAARLASTSFDQVILVGGSTRIPLVQERATAFFGREPLQSVDPDEVVAIGAAVEAMALMGRADRKARSSATVPADVVHDDLEVLLPSHSDRPSKGSENDPSEETPLPWGPVSSVAPALAMEHPTHPPPPNYPVSLTPPSAPAPATPPASSSGRVIATPPQEGASLEPPPLPILLDITPFSLCVETVGGYCDVLIAKNTRVPCERTQVFVTSKANQTTVRVRVAQGESPRFQENTQLGELELSHLRPAERGEVQIMVLFALDADGILQVRARDLATGHEAQAQLHLLAQARDSKIDELRERQSHQVIL